MKRVIFILILLIMLIFSISLFTSKLSDRNKKKEVEPTQVIEKKITISPPQTADGELVREPSSIVSAEKRLEPILEKDILGNVESTGNDITVLVGEFNKNPRSISEKEKLIDALKNSDEYRDSLINNLKNITEKANVK